MPPGPHFCKVLIHDVYVVNPRLRGFTNQRAGTLEDVNINVFLRVYAQEQGSFGALFLPSYPGSKEPRRHFC